MHYEPIINTATYRLTVLETTYSNLTLTVTYPNLPYCSHRNHMSQRADAKNHRRRSVDQSGNVHLAIYCYIMYFTIIHPLNACTTPPISILSTYLRTRTNTPTQPVVRMH